MILVEDGPGGGAAIFAGPHRLILARQPDEVAPALAEAEAARQAGAWIAGWVGYEAGMALEPRLRPLVRVLPDEPLLALAIHGGPPQRHAADTDLPDLADCDDPARVRLSPLEPLVPRADYLAAFARLAGLIAQGDCYQVNLTLPLAGRLLAGSPLGLWRRLAEIQPVAHGALVDLGVGPVILSRSPELFFRLDAEGLIETRPMKGTAPRHPDPAADRALARALALDDKNRAENLMIVDLLRNDIARLARPGSVRVPELFAVETLATVHQMSSRVVGRLAGPARLDRLMAALLPCGSVTGAPKIRAMEIIAALEPHPRGVYCGAVGWMAPDGRAAFNVAIRTLRLFPDGRLLVNAGGGVVHDSTPEGEWEEALWKTRFIEAIGRDPR